MTAPAPAKALRPEHITRALRVLFPLPVRLETRAAGPGRFTITLPATCARQLGIGVASGQPGIRWLSRHLGLPVTLESAEFPRRRYGEAARAVITISTGGGQR